MFSRSQYLGVLFSPLAVDYRLDFGSALILLTLHTAGKHLFKLHYGKFVEAQLSRLFVGHTAPLLYLIVGYDEACLLQYLQRRVDWSTGAESQRKGFGREGVDGNDPVIGAQIQLGPKQP